MSADPLEGSEPARQEFEKIAQEEWKCTPDDLRRLTGGRGGYGVHNVACAFEGFTWGRRSPSRDRWIAVEEWLPDGGVDVLAWVSKPVEYGCQVVVAFLDHGEWSTGSDGEVVTHWQPLPKAPAPPVHKGDS